MKYKLYYITDIDIGLMRSQFSQFLASIDLISILPTGLFITKSRFHPVNVFSAFLTPVLIFRFQQNAFK